MGNPKGLATYEDVAKNPKAIVGVMAGNLGEWVAGQSAVPKSRIEVLKNEMVGINALARGDIDALASDSLTIIRIARAFGMKLGFEGVEPFDMVAGKSVKEHGALGFRKEDEDLRDVFNKHLAAFIGTTEFFNLVEPLGFTQAVLPNLTTEELCSVEDRDWPWPPKPDD